MSIWLTICPLDAIAPNTGICAKVGTQQVAVFFSQRTQSFHAIGNFDPIAKANVLSRGMMGSIDGTLCVASPLYKQHFCLKTGVCLEAAEYRVPVFDVREHQGMVEVKYTEDMACTTDSTLLNQVQ